GPRVRQAGGNNEFVRFGEAGEFDPRVDVHLPRIQLGAVERDRQVLRVDEVHERRGPLQRGKPQGGRGKEVGLADGKIQGHLIRGGRDGSGASGCFFAREIHTWHEFILSRISVESRNQPPAPPPTHGEPGENSRQPGRRRSRASVSSTESPSRPPAPRTSGGRDARGVATRSASRRLSGPTSREKLPSVSIPALRSLRKYQPRSGVRALRPP